MKTMLLAINGKWKTVKLFEKVENYHVLFLDYYRNIKDIKKFLNTHTYDVLHLRYPFNKDLNRKNMWEKLDFIFDHAKKCNAHIFDNLSCPQDIKITEDKRSQYEICKKVMPKTRILEKNNIDRTTEMIKKRVSSRAQGIYFTEEEFKKQQKKSNFNTQEYICQKRFELVEEYRVYSINGKIFPQVGKRISKTETQKIKLNSVEPISTEIKEFAEKVNTILLPQMNLELIWYDIAKTKEWKIFLLEFNRSPVFNAFRKKSWINIANEIHI